MRKWLKYLVLPILGIGFVVAVATPFAVSCNSNYLDKPTIKKQKTIYWKQKDNKKTNEIDTQLYLVSTTFSFRIGEDESWYQVLEYHYLPKVYIKWNETNYNFLIEDYNKIDKDKYDIVLQEVK